ncbi:MAG: DUF3822 family protein [Prevotellaceae bacterium]|nr:DUF3822 family protein [Prevotellaceae bacterium]
MPDFIDKSFDFARIEKYRLSIQIDLNGFSFCIYDVAHNKHVVLKNIGYGKSVSDYADQSKAIAEIIENDRILKIRYPSCNCIYVSPKSTLIPEELFTESRLRNYLEFMHTLDELDEIRYKHLPELKCYCVFALPSPVVVEIAKYQQNIAFINQAYKSIYDLTRIRRNNLLVSFHPGFADMNLFYEGKLQFHNVFDIHDNMDALYYISAVVKQLGVAEDTPIRVSGEISSQDIDELSRYLPSLEAEHNRRMTLLVGYERSYRYYGLLNLHECE